MSTVSGVKQTLITPAAREGYVRTDRFLALLLLGLTFLLASFAATNSEVWMHLASGRLISEGRWQYGVDPFLHTTEAGGARGAVPWYNLNWLYGLAIYQAYQWLGGVSLVILKALAVVLLVACLLRIRPSGVGRLGVMASTLLVALAITPRVLLAPATLSYLFLGVALLILFRAGALADGSSNSKELITPRLLWRLPLLFVLWANLDAWVILGPLMILTLWAGTGLARLLGQRNAIPGSTMGLVFVTSLAACLINPHHVHVFNLPFELAYPLVQLGHVLGLALPDFLFAGGKAVALIHQYDPQPALFLSPWSSAYFSNTSLGLTVAGIAYWLLLFLNLIAFVVLSVAGGPSRFPVKRFLLWLPVAVLAGSQHRLIPLFAVVAGPVLVLSARDLFVRGDSATASTQDRRWALIRVLVVVAFLGLSALAWPGWISAPIGDFTVQRRVAWGLKEDPSLRQTAERLAELHRAKQLERVFNFTPDIANYCAWFAPGVKCTVDLRFSLYAHAAAAFGKTKRALLESASDFNADKTEERATWERGLKDFRVDHVVLSAPFGVGSESSHHRLIRAWWGRPDEWTERYADGRTFAYFWNSGRISVDERFSWQRELQRQAFGQPTLEQLPPANGTPLPGEETPPWIKYLNGVPPLPPEYNEANYLQAYFDFASRNWYGPCLYAQAVYSLNLPLGFAGAAPGSVLAPAAGFCVARFDRFIYVRPNEKPFLRSVDTGPVAYPLLAMRLARRAIAIDPHESRTYLLLLDACAMLLERQEEAWSNYYGRNQANLRSVLRKIQMTTALKTYVDLEPENPELHRRLGIVFLQLNYLDLALEHFRLAIKNLHKQKLDSPDANLIKALEQRNRRLREEVDQLEKEVAMRRRDFSGRAANSKPLEKFQIALRFAYRTVDANNVERTDARGMGLVLTALTHLREAKPETPEEAFEIARQHIDVLVTMGRAIEVEAAMAVDAIRTQLGPAYTELRLLQSAAKGDYAEMDLMLDFMEKEIRHDSIRAMVAHLVGTTLNLNITDNLPIIPRVAQRIEAAFLNSGWHNAVDEGIRQAADLRLLRGILRLEAGDTDSARQLLNESLGLAGPNMHWPDRIIAVRYLHFLDEQR